MGCCVWKLFCKKATSLQLSILQPSCRRVCGEGQRLLQGSSCGNKIRAATNTAISFAAMPRPSRSAFKANKLRQTITTIIFSSFLFPVGEASFGTAGAFLFGTGFCVALACGVATSTRGVVDGIASIDGTAKLELQAGQSIV